MNLSCSLSIVLLLVVGVGAAEAQTLQDVDPWQFPNLVNSRHFQRWWSAFQDRAYPLGEIPTEAKHRALEQTRRATTARRDAGAADSGAVWFELGPAPQLGARPVSGRATAIAVD